MAAFMWGSHHPHVCCSWRAVSGWLCWMGHRTRTPLGTRVVFFSFNLMSYSQIDPDQFLLQKNNESSFFMKQCVISRLCCMMMSWHGKVFVHHWSFMRRTHWSSVDSPVVYPHKGLIILSFAFVCLPLTWIKKKLMNKQSTHQWFEELYLHSGIRDIKWHFLCTEQLMCNSCIFFIPWVFLAKLLSMSMQHGFISGKVNNGTGDVVVSSDNKPSEQMLNKLADNIWHHYDNGYIISFSKTFQS